MSTDRIPGYAGYINPKDLPKGPNGRNLCRWCGTEVTPPARTFCSQRCVDEHKIRTQPAFAKAQMYERDHGVCETCGIDTCADLKGPIASWPYGRFRERKALSRFDMDHVIPVVEGGGSCGLENLRTLCKPHHKTVTAALRKRLALARKTAASSPQK